MHRWSGHTVESGNVCRREPLVPENHVPVINCNCQLRNLSFFSQGCLKPVKIIVPKGSLLDPSENAAVVGGNVLTSQRIVDVILAAFGVCAASQGCMNNITLGTEEWGYYETVAGGSGAVRSLQTFPFNCKRVF